MSTLLPRGVLRAWRPTGPRTRAGATLSMPLAARRRARSPTTSRRRRCARTMRCSRISPTATRRARPRGDRRCSRRWWLATRGASPAAPRGLARRGDQVHARGGHRRGRAERDEGRDCHAEVLARRGMKRFLYAQIRSAASLARRGGRETRRGDAETPRAASGGRRRRVARPRARSERRGFRRGFRKLARPPGGFVPPVRVVGAVRQRDGEAVGAGRQGDLRRHAGPVRAPGAVRAGPRGRRARQEAQLVRVRGGGPTRVPVETRPEKPSRPDDNDDDDDARRRPARRGTRRGGASRDVHARARADVQR